MLTPLGAIYSTNITPDVETGIGSYTFDEFNNAIKHGVRKDGSALYPAMPFPSYQIMPDEDVAAMYAYFMSAVEPVRRANQPSELPPVLNWRWPLAYWQPCSRPSAASCRKRMIRCSPGASISSRVRGTAVRATPGVASGSRRSRCRTPNPAST